MIYVIYLILAISRSVASIEWLAELELIDAVSEASCTVVDDVLYMIAGAGDNDQHRFLYKYSFKSQSPTWSKEEKKWSTGPGTWLVAYLRDRFQLLIAVTALFAGVNLTTPVLSWK